MVDTDVHTVPKCKTAAEFPWDVYSKANYNKENKSHFK